jgi:hypothetical protein
MLTDDGTHQERQETAMTSWYQPPEKWEPATKPPELTFNGQQGPYPVEVETAGGGLPVVYRANALVGGAGALTAPGVVADLDAALAGRGWTVTVLPPHGDEVICEILGARPDAAVALDILRRGAPAARPRTAAAIATLALRRHYFVGMPGKLGAPAKDGHAGTRREARAVLGTAPSRAPAAGVPGGRRPVVALLDTGIGRHPWLDGTDGDPFWVDARPDWQPGVDPPPDEGTGGITDADTHSGHGTFLAGLVRQAAPDARVLSMHAMRGDGSLDEHLVLDALAWLYERVARAVATGDPARFVDIVCLAFGYYEQDTDDEEHTGRLRQLLGDLGQLGVQVVVSAGNQSSDTPCFPAALAGCQPRPEVRMRSVGALNPDGYEADYTNFGGWVTDWEVGTALVSTVPAFGVRHRHGDEPGPHEYEPDNLVSGFAGWGGTSFAAGAFAARLAGALCAGGADLRDLSLTAVSYRVAAALAAIGHGDD